MIQKIARAKINLYLNVVGKRDDGYHLLDSLFAFAEDGDGISVEKSDNLTLEIKGPFAHALSSEKDNSVLKAARLLANALDVPAKAKIVLTKNLPAASGIGGGSADAAATLAALCELWKVRPSVSLLEKTALKIGADVPACLHDKAVFVSGIGECVRPAPRIPRMPVLLVNPNVALPTPLVFKAGIERFSDADSMTEGDFLPQNFIAALKRRKNDLTVPATRIVPEIGTILNAFEKCSFCAVSRLSGSGATCFGIFEDAARRDVFAESLKEKHPNWWIFRSFLI